MSSCFYASFLLTCCDTVRLTWSETLPPLPLCTVWTWRSNKLVSRGVDACRSSDLGLNRELKRIQASSIKLHVQYSERVFFLFVFVIFYFIFSFLLYSVLPLSSSVVSQTDRYRKDYCTVSLRAHKGDNYVTHFLKSRTCVRYSSCKRTLSHSTHTCIDSGADLRQFHWHHLSAVHHFASVLKDSSDFWSGVVSGTYP